MLRASWGVASKINGAAGIVANVTSRSEIQTMTETDKNGSVDGVFEYDQATTISADLLIDKNTSKPDVGERITIGDEQGWIEDCEIAESNASYRKLHITVKFTHNVNEVTALSWGV